MVIYHLLIFLCLCPLIKCHEILSDRQALQTVRQNQPYGVFLICVYDECADGNKRKPESINLSSRTGP